MAAEDDHFWTPVLAFMDTTLIQGDHANSVWPVTTQSGNPYGRIKNPKSVIC